MNDKPEPVTRRKGSHDGLAAVAITLLAAALIAMAIIKLV